MKTQLKYIISNLLLVGTTGAALLLVGCPEEEPKEEEHEHCESHADCEGEEVCLATEDDEEKKECRAPKDCSEAKDAAAYCATKVTLAEGETATCDTTGDTPTCVKQDDASCAAHTDCEAGHYCDTTANECKEGCAEDSCTEDGEYCLPTDADPDKNECRAPKDCSEAKDVATYCVADLMLMAGADVYCDATSKMCTAGCVEDSCTEDGEHCLPTDADPDKNECRAPKDCSEAKDVATYCATELMLMTGETATCDENVDPPVCVKDSM